VYALGCLLYECLTGTIPFERDEDAAILWAHINEPPPPVTDRNPVLPVAVDEVVATAMAKAPEDRFQTARALVAALRAALGSGAPPAISGPRAIPEFAAPAPDRSPPDSLPGPEPAEGGRREDRRPRRPRPTRPKSTRPKSTRPKPARGEPARRLLVLSGVVLLAVVVVAGALLLRGRDQLATYSPTSQVPFWFSYPARWL
jgi:serine/threonine protein kinase